MVCSHYHLLSVQVFTQRVCWPDSTVLQVSGSTGSGSLDSWFLCSLVWAMSTFCSRVWGPGSSESFFFLIMIQLTVPVTSRPRRRDNQQLKWCVWLADSQREGSRREDRLSGSSTHLSISWNQFLPNRQVLPISGNTEGKAKTTHYTKEFSFVAQEVKMWPEAWIPQ